MRMPAGNDEQLFSVIEITNGELDGSPLDLVGVGALFWVFGIAALILVKLAIPRHGPRY